MILKTLSAEGYRNLAGGTLTLSNGVNLLYGENAAGKTNTLECAYLFACGRSFRTHKETDLIALGKETANCSLTLESAGRTRTMALTVHQSKAYGYVKKMRLDGYEVAKASEFLGIFRAVLFTPDHLSLIKGKPEERRRFLDIALSQLDARCVYDLNAYLKMLDQKNAYLRRVSLSGRADEDFLDVLNRSLAESGARVIEKRKAFISLLKDHAASYYASLTEKRDALALKYLCAVKEETAGETQTADALYALFRADMPSDVRAGHALHGPHKEDFVLTIEKTAGEVPVLEETDDVEESGNVTAFAARSFGSQGEQRSAVLALKLAEAAVSREKTGEYPVLLLDDLLGELDRSRRRVLLSLIRDRQTVITCCDRDAFPESGDVNAVRVENGQYFTE